MPTPRAGAMAATSRGKVYVIGGYGGVGYLQAVEEYDPRTDTWVEKADLPVPGLVPLASFGALSEILAVFATADIEAGLPVLSTALGRTLGQDETTSLQLPAWASSSTCGPAGRGGQATPHGRCTETGYM